MKRILPKTSRALTTTILTTTLAMSQVAVADGVAYEYVPVADISARFSKSRNIGELNYMHPLKKHGNHLPIIDLKLKADNNRSKEINLGLVYRYNYDDKAILGTYAYYDHRVTENNFAVSGATIGAEVLSKYVDVRANYYVSQKRRKKIAHNNRKTVEIKGTSIYAVSGGHKYQSAYDGYDVEVGAPLFSFSEALNDKLGTKVYAGKYNFTAKNVKPIKGTRFRLEQDLGTVWAGNNSVKFHLNAETQFDKVRRRQNFVGIGMKVAFNDKKNKGKKKSSGLSYRMMDTVIRDVDIVTGNKQEDPTISNLFLNGQKKDKLYYVANAQEGYEGDGTKEKPFSIEQLKKMGDISDAMVVLTSIDKSKGGKAITEKEYNDITSRSEVLNGKKLELSTVGAEEVVSVTVNGKNGVYIDAVNIKNTKIIIQGKEIDPTAKGNTEVATVKLVEPEIINTIKQEVQQDIEYRQEQQRVAEEEQYARDIQQQEYMQGQGQQQNNIPPAPIWDGIKFVVQGQQQQGQGQQQNQQQGQNQGQQQNQQQGQNQGQGQQQQGQGQQQGQNQDQNDVWNDEGGLGLRGLFGDVDGEGQQQQGQNQDAVDNNDKYDGLEGLFADDKEDQPQPNKRKKRDSREENQKKKERRQKQAKDRQQQVQNQGQGQAQQQPQPGVGAAQGAGAAPAAPAAEAPQLYNDKPSKNQKRKKERYSKVPGQQAGVDVAQGAGSAAPAQQQPQPGAGPVAAAQPDNDMEKVNALLAQARQGLRAKAEAAPQSQPQPQPAPAQPQQPQPQLQLQQPQSVPVAPALPPLLYKDGKFAGGQPQPDNAPPPPPRQNGAAVPQPQPAPAAAAIPPPPPVREHAPAALQPQPQPVPAGAQADLIAAQLDNDMEKVNALLAQARQGLRAKAEAASQSQPQPQPAPAQPQQPQPQLQLQQPQPGVGPDAAAQPGNDMEEVNALLAQAKQVREAREAREAAQAAAELTEKNRGLDLANMDSPKKEVSHKRGNSAGDLASQLPKLRPEPGDNPPTVPAQENPPTAVLDNEYFGVAGLFDADDAVPAPSTPLRPAVPALSSPIASSKSSPATPLASPPSPVLPKATPSLQSVPEDVKQDLTAEELNNIQTTYIEDGQQKHFTQKELNKFVQDAVKDKKAKEDFNRLRESVAQPKTDTGLFASFKDAASSLLGFGRGADAQASSSKGAGGKQKPTTPPRSNQPKGGAAAWGGQGASAPQTPEASQQSKKKVADGSGNKPRQENSPAKPEGLAETSLKDEVPNCKVAPAEGIEVAFNKVLTESEKNHLTAVVRGAPRQQQEGNVNEEFYHLANRKSGQPSKKPPAFVGKAPLSPTITQAAGNPMSPVSPNIEAWDPFNINSKASPLRNDDAGRVRTSPKGKEQESPELKGEDELADGFMLPRAATQPQPPSPLSSPEAPALSPLASPLSSPLVSPLSSPEASPALSPAGTPKTSPAASQSSSSSSSSSTPSGIGNNAPNIKQKVLNKTTEEFNQDADVSLNKIKESIEQLSRGEASALGKKNRLNGEILSAAGALNDELTIRATALANDIKNDKDKELSQQDQRTLKARQKELAEVQNKQKALENTMVTPAMIEEIQKADNKDKLRKVLKGMSPVELDLAAGHILSAKLSDSVDNAPKTLQEVQSQLVENMIALEKAKQQDKGSGKTKKSDSIKSKINFEGNNSPYKVELQSFLQENEHKSLNELQGLQKNLEGQIHRTNATHQLEKEIKALEEDLTSKSANTDAKSDSNHKTGALQKIFDNASNALKNHEEAKRELLEMREKGMSPKNDSELLVSLKTQLNNIQLSEGRNKKFMEILQNDSKDYEDEI